MLWLPIVLWVLALVLLVFLALVKHAPAPAGSFSCPAVPFVPCGALAVNAFMLAGLDWLAWVCVIAWALLGLVIYLAYGIRHSNLRKSRDLPPEPMELGTTAIAPSQR